MRNVIFPIFRATKPVNIDILMFIETNKQIIEMFWELLIIFGHPHAQFGQFSRILKEKESVTYFYSP